LLADFIPFEEPNGGPNFYPFATDAVYNIKIDNNGDARPDVVYRWKFHNVDKRGGNTFLYNNGPVTSIGDQNLLFRQTYTLQASFNGGPFQTRVANAPVAPSRVGPASMPDYARLRHQAVTSLPGGWKTSAGQADDPFFLDLRVFDLLYGTNLKEVGQDTLAGYNVNTIAIQVPFRDVALNENAKRNPVIGIWSTAGLTPRQAPADQLAASIARAQQHLRAVPGDYDSWAALGSAYIARPRYRRSHVLPEGRGGAAPLTQTAAQGESGRPGRTRGARQLPPPVRHRPGSCPSCSSHGSLLGRRVRRPG
jgi:hypothetical protein